MTSPADLAAWISPGLPMVAARALGLAWTAPGLGLNLPGLGWRLRLAIAALLGVALAPAVGAKASIGMSSSWLIWIGALAIEGAIGAALGIGAALVIAAARQAGEIVGAQAGLSPASLLDPADHDGADGEITAIGHLYGLVALAIFLALDGPLRLAVGLAQSYDAIPAALGVSPPDAAVAAAFGRVGWSLALAVRLAAPAGLALVLAGLALAWVTRSSRGASIANLAWPARSALGVALAWLGLIGLAATLAEVWG